MDTLFYGNSPRQLIVAASIAAGVLLLFILLRSFAAIKLKNAHQTTSDVDDFLLDLARRTKVFLLFFPAVFLGIRALEVPLDLRRLIRLAALLAFMAQLVVWSTGVIDFWIRRHRRSRIETDPAAVMTMNVFRVAAIAMLWMIAIVVTMHNLGINVTTLIAGLGIGGVAVALATQNILGDLFASLSIVVDKPFVLGDAITVDEHSGTVEHIGMKTTRLRGVGGEQLIFSNGDLLKSRIRNFQRMSERRALAKISVDHHTAPESLARVPLLMQAAVEKQHLARFGRAHFIGFGDAGLDLELVYHVTGADYHTFLDIQQAVNLDVLRGLEAEGIELATKGTGVGGRMQNAERRT
ncbi:MAG TPA: mechanosensitive ion channel family protein [Thermoanaerobaculia bacterium]|nr:mechanosensitive ion channel family protein [Thermoanaerobaculia bacterium]